MKKTWFTALLGLLITLTVEAQELKTGPWRFELKMAHTSVPFIVEFNFVKKRLQGKLYNGEETITLTDILYRKQSLNIPLGPYESSLEFTIESPTKVSGKMVKHNKNPKVELPVVGTYGELTRFPGNHEKPTIDLSGRWSLTLDDEGTKSQAVGTFKQKENHFTGSILTPTGDYRYLEGYVSGASFEAASFDGVYNYVFKGKVEGGKLNGSLLSNLIVQVSGNLDASAALPNAYEQTQIEALKFSFPDLKGKKVSLEDAKFKNKPVIIVFFGSWCPNCIDEMNYLIPWYKDNTKRGIEIVALSFERSLNDMEAKRQLNKIQKKYQVPYPLLIAGTTSADKPMEKIQGLKNFKAFPTTVFLNRKHEVVKVHSGFNGPSTGEFFEKWKEEFNETVNELVKK